MNNLFPVLLLVWWSSAVASIFWQQFTQTHRVAAYYLIAFLWIIGTEITRQFMGIRHKWLKPETLGNEQ